MRTADLIARVQHGDRDGVSGRDAWLLIDNLAEALLAAEAQAEAYRLRMERLEEAAETFAILVNEDTAYLPDEHVISLTYDDSDLDDDLGGPNTLLGERYMRAFRRLAALLSTDTPKGG